MAKNSNFYMTKTPLFSILVAHYNNFAFFPDFYRSVLQQTYQNFEIVIVDDCSTDESLSQIRALTANDSRFRIFENEKNEGVGFTKKKCIELANGEICGFIDPDDAVTEDALHLSVQQYEKDPKIVAAYSQLIFCDENLKSVKLFTRTRKIKNGEKYFFNINNEVSHFFTFKKEKYALTSGINEELRYAEDFDLYLKMYEKGNFKYISKPLYFYRRHEKGLTQDKNKSKKVHEYWNKVLFDTCVRRGINNIDGVPVHDQIDLAKVLFERENTVLKKIKRKINALISG